MTHEHSHRTTGGGDDDDARQAPPPGEAGEQVLQSAAPDVPEPIDWKDRYVRLAADFDNHKKRTRAELAEMRERERERVILEWLEVVDSVDRAVLGCRGQEGPWVEGLEAIGRQVRHVLDRLEVVAMQSDEASFDPHRHEAIGAVAVPGVPDGTVLQTERKGYLLRNGRVLRPARVVVARNG